MPSLSTHHRLCKTYGTRSWSCHQQTLLFYACCFIEKMDATSQSWLVLPKTQGVTGYRCVCLSRAAQLPSWGLAVSLVSLSHTCCFYRRHTCAISAFCATEAVHRKVCWLTCCVPPLKHRLALRNSVGVPSPTDTYGSHCLQYLLDPPSAHIPSCEKPGIELPTDCLRGSRLNHMC